jgi:hypothetical protein
MQEGSEITLDSVVVASRDQVCSDLGAETAILGLRRNAYYSVDRVGKRIWELLQTPRSVAAILAALLARYEVDPGRCRDDLLRLLRALHDEGLIEIRHGAA